MTSITIPRLVVTLVAVGAAALPAAAQAGTVKSGALSWTQYNVYDTGQPAGTDRTWLGYVTSTLPPSALGSATPIAPATGDTVTPSSTRGTGTTAPNTTTFPATSGTYDATDGTGTIELDGALEYTSAAHGFDITIEKPKLVLDGFSGKLYASGKGGGSNPTYDRSTVLFNLNLTNATVALKADGSRVISGIVPSLATLNAAFPGNYAVGSGPDRTPNTFGSFSLTVKTNGGDTGAKGDTGAAGKDGAAGANGKDGATATIRTVKAVLAKAPYTGSATRKVTVYSTTNKKLATGTIKGRVLKVTLADKVTSLSGKVKVKVSGAKSSKTVSIPS